MSKIIRVDEDTHAALTALKGDDETFDQFLSRLVEKRRQSVHDGAGFWEDTVYQLSEKGTKNFRGRSAQ